MSLPIYRIYIFCDFFLSVFSKTAKTRKIFGILWSGFISHTEEVEVDVYTKFHRARSIRTLKKIGGTESLNIAMMAMAMTMMMAVTVKDAPSRKYHCREQCILERP